MIKGLKKWIFLLLIIVTIHFTGCSFLNRFQKEGTLHLSGLKEPVTVLRDNEAPRSKLRGITAELRRSQPAFAF